MAKHAQITQNNKFAISLQYLKIDMNIDMNRYEKILQIGIIVLMEVASHVLCYLFQTHSARRSNVFMFIWLIYGYFFV